MSDEIEKNEFLEAVNKLSMDAKMSYIVYYLYLVYSELYDLNAYFEEESEKTKKLTIDIPRSIREGKQKFVV